MHTTTARGAATSLFPTLFAPFPSGEKPKVRVWNSRSGSESLPAQRGDSGHDQRSRAAGQARPAKPAARPAAKPLGGAVSAMVVDERSVFTGHAATGAEGGLKVWPLAAHLKNAAHQNAASKVT
eukprot:CAMPEP_0172597678 /NCGR_PEP_ID=MMETSP1068-20121228/17641_1 /TAXON_ID=35684 /ORGANISM="Pseudopedinella elastica, Strain CCMP716" /LENGTH=123 /DNA_ID=CAMNT_0013397247 /DNA_START=163 /DNA_END=534 /DNA_ORIENTATION=+